MHVDRKYDHDPQKYETFRHHQGRVDGGLPGHEEGSDDHGDDIDEQAEDQKA